MHEKLSVVTVAIRPSTVLNQHRKIFCQLPKGSFSSVTILLIIGNSDRPNRYIMDKPNNYFFVTKNIIILMLFLQKRLFEKLNKVNYYLVSMSSSFEVKY